LRRVAADLRLGEPETADELAFAELWQPPLLLVLGAELQDGELDERDLDRERRPHRRVGAADLFGHERVRHVVDADPAVLLRDWPAEEPEGRHLFEHVFREDLVAVALARARRDLSPGEFLRELADLLLLRAEVEVHRAESTERPPCSPDSFVG